MAKVVSAALNFIVVEQCRQREKSDLIVGLLSRAAEKIGVKDKIHCRSDFSCDEYATFLEGELPSELKFSVVQEHDPLMR